MRDSEWQRHKVVERANYSLLVNRLVAPHLKELQEQGLATAIPPGELKVRTFLEAGLDVFRLAIQPSVAQAMQDQVQTMKRWPPKQVMNFLLTSRESPEDSTDLIPRLRKAETPRQATYLLVEVLVMQLESDPDLLLDLSQPPQRIPTKL